jgi:hypothetical protein
VNLGSQPTTVAGPAGRRPFIRQFFSWRRPGEADLRFGVRLAVSGTILFYPVLLLGMLVGRVEGEASLGLTLAYWLFIGLSQLIYLIPAIVIAAWRGRPTVAKGLALGGAIIAAVDAIAWAVGVYVVGAR